MKLSLNRLKLMDAEMLSRDELKTVFGGGGSCGAYLPSGSGPGNDTQFEPPYPSASGGDGQPTILRGVSYGEAMSLTQGVQGARWCCASCATSSWY